MRRVSLAGLALVGALLLAIPSAFAKSDLVAADPGITASSIKIGGTFPLTGSASSYAPIPQSMKAYFSYINARKGPDGKRGVYGRQIVYNVYDDGYNPAQTVPQVRRLVIHRQDSDRLSHRRAFRAGTWRPDAEDHAR